MVIIYAEGGGETNATQDQCRRGFGKYIEKVVPRSVRRPRVIACGGRTQAFHYFCRESARDATNYHVLLVDAEDPVADVHVVDPWQHLHQRDGWPPPRGVVPEQAQLMVICVEAWLVADPEALAAWYGQGFRAEALPSTVDLEHVPKPDVYRALQRATRDTRTKGEYGKGHAFELVGLISPIKVESRCKRLAPRFHELIRTRCG